MNKKETDEIRNRVIKGAKLLDEKVPDWYQKIDLKTLDLNNTCKCVLGQTTGFCNGMDNLLNGDSQEMENHGFDLHSDYVDCDRDSELYFKELQRHWRILINYRKCYK